MFSQLRRHESVESHEFISLVKNSRNSYTQYINYYVILNDSKSLKLFTQQKMPSFDKRYSNSQNYIIIGYNQHKSN